MQSNLCKGIEGGTICVSVCSSESFSAPAIHPVDFVSVLDRVYSENRTLPLLSQQLRTLLAKDALASDLLHSQPGVLYEMDVRAKKLWSHIHGCRAPKHKQLL